MAREESRKRDNQRKRMRTLYNRLEKQAQQQSGEALRQTRREQAKVQRAIKASYYDRNKGKYKVAYEKLEARTQQPKQHAIQQAQRTKPKKKIDNERITKMQVNYFRSAARTEAQKQAGEPLTQQQKLARAEQSFFLAATRVLWQGGSPYMRYENIVEGLKSYRVTLANGRMVENLQDAVQFVKEQYRGQYPTLAMVKEGYFDLEESETIEDSPRPISGKRLRGFSQ